MYVRVANQSSCDSTAFHSLKCCRTLPKLDLPLVIGMKRPQEH